MAAVALAKRCAVVLLCCRCSCYWRTMSSGAGRCSFSTSRLCPTATQTSATRRSDVCKPRWCRRYTCVGWRRRHGSLKAHRWACVVGCGCVGPDHVVVAVRAIGIELCVWCTCVVYFSCFLRRQSPILITSRFVEALFVMHGCSSHPTYAAAVAEFQHGTSGSLSRGCVCHL